MAKMVFMCKTQITQYNQSEHSDVLMSLPHGNELFLHRFQDCKRIGWVGCWACLLVELATMVVSFVVGVDNQFHHLFKTPVTLSTVIWSAHRMRRAMS
jgi:hypothetical protein